MSLYASAVCWIGSAIILSLILTVVVSMTLFYGEEIFSFCLSHTVVILLQVRSLVVEIREHYAVSVQLFYSCMNEYQIIYCIRLVGDEIATMIHKYSREKISLQ
jgi:hypothetical protein